MSGEGFTDDRVVKLCGDLSDLARSEQEPHAFRSGVAAILRRSADVDHSVVLAAPLGEGDAAVAGTGWPSDVLRVRGHYYNQEVLMRAGAEVFSAPQKAWFEMVSEFRARRLTVLDTWHDLIESEGLQSCVLRHWIVDGLFNVVALARQGHTPFPTAHLRGLEIAFQMVKIGDHLARQSWRPKVLLGLPRRQAEVVALLTRGLRNAEIASLLGISAITVRNQLSAIYSKLGVSTRAELVYLAMSGEVRVPAGQPGSRARFRQHRLARPS